MIFSKELFTSQKQHFSINCYKELILFINIIHRYFIFSYAFTVRRTIFYFGDRKYYFDGTNFSLFNTTRSSHRDSFPKYLFFFSRSNLFIIFQEEPFVPRTDMNFPGGSLCSSNRHEFSRRVYMFFEQTRIFQEGLSKRHVFSRRFYLFVEQTLLSHRTEY